MYTPEGFIGKKTIIVGEVNTGKTAYLNNILEEFRKAGQKDLTIIDMAPESVKGIGGKMYPGEPGSGRYLSAPIVPPRLTGESEKEVKLLAEQNAVLIDQLFSQYLNNPSKALFINDVSIYLQAGGLDKLLLLLDSTPTVIMNGYLGHSLGGGELGERERRNMTALQERCDRVISLKEV